MEKKGSSLWTAPIVDTLGRPVNARTRVRWGALLGRRIQILPVYFQLFFGPPSRRIVCRGGRLHPGFFPPHGTRRPGDFRPAGLDRDVSRRSPLPMRPEGRRHPEEARGRPPPPLLSPRPGLNSSVESSRAARARCRSSRRPASSSPCRPRAVPPSRAVPRRFPRRRRPSR